MPRLVVHAKDEPELLYLLRQERTKIQVVGLGEPLGFIARLFPSKSRPARCYLNYRLKPNGPVKWLPLGAFPDESLDQIRQRANEARRIFLAGGDPTICRFVHIFCGAPR
jgi:hypothetical protein